MRVGDFANPHRLIAGVAGSQRQDRDASVLGSGGDDHDE